MTSRTHGALYDSEAALRLVDTTLHEMTGVSSEAVAPQPGGSALNIDMLAHRLEQGYAELVRTLGTLRRTRTELEQSAVAPIHVTHDKLKQVSAATEVAATDILNGIDRAVAMVDELDSLDGQDPDQRSAEVRATLRDELFAVMGHMQFQDITSQQLAHASAVLSQMEVRLVSLCQLFDPANAPARATLEVTGAFDPQATTEGREQRQAVADAVLASRPGAD